MSLHDGYARFTPFELAFQDRDVASKLAEEVEEEAAARKTSFHDPHSFLTLGTVAAFLEGIRPPDSAPEAIHTYGALAFHGVHFVGSGCPLYLLTSHVARYLVEGAPPGAPEAPSRAGYVQLPQHLFWTAPVGGGAPESVDGVFWTLGGQGSFHTMVATGLRPDRAGLGVTPLPEAPMADARLWVEAQVREQGDDFESDLPGGELDNLYSFQAAGEVLKLLARLFAYIGSVPCSLEDPQVAEGSSDGPTPSVLPYVRIKLDA